MPNLQACALTVALLVPANAALAQDATELSTLPVTGGDEAADAKPTPRRSISVSGTIEEIVVTAQKREQSLNDVPIAISAFSGDDLAAMGVTDTRDLSAVVPGFTYADSGFNTPVYTLRGIGFNESSQTASSTVGIYVDEFNLPFPVMSKGANLDLERVEVLKGPQGTLYGRNTTGGAVNYIAKKPTGAFESGLMGTYASYQTVDVEGFVSGPLTDTVGARLALRSVTAGRGWQYSLTRPNDSLGQKDKQSARLGLDWQASEAFKMRLAIDGWRDASEPQAPQAVYIRAQNPALGDAALDQEVRDAPLVSPDTNDLRAADWTTGLHYQLHDTFLMAALRGDWSLGDTMTLTGLGSVAQFRSDGSTLPQSGLAVQYVTDRVMDVNTQAASAELRLAADPIDDVHLLVGLFGSGDTVSEVQDYYAGKVSAVFPQPVVGSPVADRLVLLGDQTATTQAVFGNVEWQFQPTLAFTLGTRYTHERRKFSGCSADSPNRTQGVGFGPIFTAIGLGSINKPEEIVAFAQNLSVNPNTRNGDCFTTNVDTGTSGKAHPPPLSQSNLSGRVALDWKPVDNALYYLSFSRGFKSGSFPILSSSRSDQYTPVTQERLDAYEAGTKTALFDGLMQGNGALFYYDYKDKQLLSRIDDQFFGPLPVLANAPKSRVLGAELELRFNVVEGLFLSMSGAYLDTKILKFQGINNDGNPEDYAGQPFNFTPKLTYSLLTSYNRPLGNGLSVMAGADYSHTSKTNAQLGDDPRFSQPAYSLVNLRAGVSGADKRWDLTLFVRNVFDEYYVIGVFNPGDTIGRYTGAPRNAGVSFAYHYF